MAFRDFAVNRSFSGNGLWRCYEKQGLARHAESSQVVGYVQRSGSPSQQPPIVSIRSITQLELTIKPTAERTLALSRDVREIIVCLQDHVCPCAPPPSPPNPLLPPAGEGEKDILGGPWQLAK